MIEPTHDEYKDAAARLEFTYKDSGLHPKRDTYVDQLGYGLWIAKYLNYYQTLQHHENSIRAVQNDIAKIEGRPLPFPPPPEPPVIQGRTGIVQLSDYCMKDDQGTELFLGASMFWALWGIQYDYARTIENMRWMSQRGVQFIRVLGEVGGGDWSDRVVDPRLPSYIDSIRKLMTEAKKCGLRVEWTIFGGGCLTKEQEWSAATDKFIDALRTMLDCVQFVEISNEGQGPSTEQIRSLASRVRSNLTIPVALTGTPENGLGEIYKNSRANMYTLHISRDYGEEGWRYTRQFKHEIPNLPKPGVDNEGVGIQSSISMDDDPVRQTSATINAYICNGAARVFHHGAGIYGKGVSHPSAGMRKANCWEQPTMEKCLSLMVEAKLRLPKDLPNWRRVTHGAQGHPLRFSTAVGDAVYAGADGCNRAYAGISTDGRWVCLISGIEKRVEFSVGTKMRLWSLETGKVERVGPGNYQLKEKFDDGSYEWGRSVLLVSE